MVAGRRGGGGEVHFRGLFRCPGHYNLFLPMQQDPPPPLVLPIQAATRGDGAEGEDVTYNAPSIRGLPLDISQPAASPAAHASSSSSPSPLLPPLLEVRGEVYMTQQDLVKVRRRGPPTNRGEIECHSLPYMGGGLPDAAGWMISSGWE